MAAIHSNYFTTNSNPNVFTLGQLVGLDGTVSNLSDIKYVMPEWVATGLSNDFWNTNTVFLSPTGNDTTFVIGDPTHPVATFTNAFSRVPNGGSIWFLGTNQTNTVAASTGIPDGKSFTVVNLGNNTLAGADFSTAITNYAVASVIDFWGGQYNIIFFGVTNAWNTAFHYINFYNNGLYTTAGATYNVDVFLTGNYLLDHCVLNSTYDCSINANVNAIDCTFISDARTSTHNPARCWVGNQFGFYSYMKDCNLIAFGATGSVIGKNNVAISLIPLPGSTAQSIMVLDNVRFVTPPTNQVLLDGTRIANGGNIYAKGSSAVILLKNMVMPAPNFITTDGVAQVISTPVSNGSSRTFDVFNNSLTYNGVSSIVSNTLAPTSISFPATTATWTNTFGKNIQVYIDNSGVTETAIKKNGTQIFSNISGDVTFGLQPGEYFSETYSAGTPTATWSPF